MIKVYYTSNDHERYFDQLLYAEDGERTRSVRIMTSKRPLPGGETNPIARYYNTYHSEEDVRAKTSDWNQGGMTLFLDVPLPDALQAALDLPVIQEDTAQFKYWTKDGKQPRLKETLTKSGEAGN